MILSDTSVHGFVVLPQLKKEICKNNENIGQDR